MTATTEIETQQNHGVEKHIEEREFSINTSVPESNKLKLRFLVIDSPEKWEEASKITGEHVMSLPSGKIAKIKVRAISFSEWESIESRYPAPQQPRGTTNITAYQDYKERVKKVERMRQVAIFELSTGKSIPGDNIEDKSNWLMKFGAGQCEHLFDAITDIYSGCVEGQLSIKFKNEILPNVLTEVKEIDSLEDLLEEASAGAIFYTSRQNNDYIMEFRLDCLSDEILDRIDRETTPPLPPGKPGKNPKTGLPDVNNMEYNFEDLNYIKQVTSISRKRILLQISAAIGFKIPGETEEEKFSWLVKRPFGDIIRLKNYIENEIVNYGKHLNFF